MKKIIMSTFIIFILFFPLHFLYDLTSSYLFIPFSPVNESIFEHLKMFLSANILFGIINYIFFKEKNINISIFKRFITSVSIFLIIYLPIYYTIGENLLITLIILLIAIFLTEVIMYKLPINNHKKISNYLSLIIIIIALVLFTYFSYKPLKYDLFIDPSTNTYGFKKES